MRLKHALMAALTVAVLPGVGSAQTFSCITNTSGSCNAADGAQSYLSWSLSEGVLTIVNKAAVANASFIGQIYLAGDGAQTAALQGQSAGVAFQSGAVPALLPAEKSTGFSTETSWSAIRQGSNKDGVDAGEWISFQIVPSGMRSVASLASKPLQFGVHLQGVGEQGWSESLIGTVSAVPEPQTYAMLVAGLGLIGSMLRRRRATS